MRHRPDFDDAALARDIGPVEPLLPRPLRRVSPRAPRRWRAAGRTLGRILGAAAVIALLSVLASERRVADPPLAGEAAFVPRYAAPAVAPPVWTEVAADRYRLGEEATGSAKVQPGLREDTLTAGTFAAQEAPFLRLVAVEAAEPEGEGSLFVTLARRAAEAGGLSVARTGERGQLTTRFGALDTVDATLAGEDGRRACTAFRLGTAPLHTAPLRLEGWLCAPLGQLPEPQAVTCAVDRLAALPGAGLAPAVAEMLAQPRRPACAPEEPATTAAVPASRVRKNAARVRHSRPASP